MNEREEQMTIEKFSKLMQDVLEDYKADDPETFEQFEDGVRTALMWVDQGTQLFGALRLMRILRGLRTEQWGESSLIIGIPPRAEE